MVLKEYTQKNQRTIPCDGYNISNKDKFTSYHKKDQIRGLHYQIFSEINPKVGREKLPKLNLILIDTHPFCR